MCAVAADGVVTSCCCYVSGMHTSRSRPQTWVSPYVTHSFHGWDTLAWVREEGRGMLSFFPLTSCQWGLQRRLSGQECLRLSQRTHVQFPAHTRSSTTSCNSSCRGSHTLFWQLWSPKYVCLHTNKSKINFEKIPPLHRTFPFFLTSHLRCFCNCFASWPQAA